MGRGFEVRVFTGFLDLEKRVVGGFWRLLETLFLVDRCLWAEHCKRPHSTDFIGVLRIDQYPVNGDGLFQWGLVLN